MCAMRRFQLALAFVSSLALATLTAGCGDTFDAQVSCSDDTTCLTKAGSLFVGDSGVNTLPLCCGGVCVLPSGGCDSGYRYLTSEPAFGTCALMPGCPSMPDMSMSSKPDLAKVD
jgi:hypothetical protein